MKGSSSMIEVRDIQETKATISSAAIQQMLPDLLHRGDGFFRLPADGLVEDAIERAPAEGFAGRDPSREKLDEEHGPSKGRRRIRRGERSWPTKRPQANAPIRMTLLTRSGRWRARSRETKPPVEWPISVTGSPSKSRAIASA